MALKFLNNGYFAGKVGIGTESPSVALQLGNSTLGQTKLAIFNSEGGGEVGLTIQSRTNRAKLRVADNDSNAYVVAEAGKAFFGTSANGDATNVTVLTSGNVGIGATNPLRKLHVVGQLAVNNATTEYYGVLMSGGEGADPSVLIGDWHNSSGTIKWDSTGNYLRIDSQHSTANAAILFSGNDGSTEYMRIASTGNVGIGTTSPGSKLEVNVVDDGFDDIDVLKLKRTWATGSGTDRAHGILFSDLNSRMATIYADRTNSGSNYNSDLLFATNTGTSGTSLSTKMVIKAGGNVGIGTTSPISLLQVGTNLASDGVAYIGDYDSQFATNFFYRNQTAAQSTVPMMLIRQTNTGDNQPVLVLDQDGTGDILQAFTDTSQVVTIDYEGNVGIGATGPGYKLEINSGTTNVTSAFKSADNQAWISIQDDDSGTYGALIGIDSDESENFVVANASASKMLSLNSSGSLKLHNYNSTNNIGTPTYVLGTDASGNVVKVLGSGIPGVPAGSGTVNYLARWTPDVNTLATGVTYDNGTNVGILTTNPLDRLQVSGVISATANDTAYSNGYFAKLSSDYGPNALKLTSRTGDILRASGYGSSVSILTGNPTSVKMFIDSSGKVGIGTTSPQSKLHIETGSGGTYSPNVNHDDVTIEGSGNIGLQLFSPATSYQYIAFGDPGSVNAGYLRYYHGTNEMVFRTNGSDNMVIDDDGNVGIGTTSPNSKLTVWDSGTFDVRTSGINVHRPSSYGQYGSFSYDGATTYFASTYTGNAAISYGTFVFKQYNNGTVGRNALEILNDGNFIFNQYAGSALTGTPTYLLGTDASGNVVKTNTVPGSGAGPYLPLSAGSSYPLTGDLYITKAVTPLIQLTDTTNSKTLLLGVDDANAFIRTGASENLYLQVNGGTNAITILNNSNVGIGTTSPSEKLVVDGKVIINNTNPPNNLAQLNIGYTGAGETRAIDIDGSWGGGENKSITFTYGSAAANIVGQINCVLVNGTDTRLRWGKLYHNADSSTYTMELKSTSTTTANLTVAGSIQMADDTDTASADKVGTMRYRTATNEPVPVTGTELVTNGDLASSTGWNLQNSASINNTTGVATVPGAGSLTSTGGNWSLYQSNVMAPNKTYMLRFQARRDAGPNANMYAGWAYTNQFNQTVTAAWVQYQVVFTTGAQTWHELTFGGVTGTTFEVKDITVVEVTEEDASYADMCMQTGASTYEWVNIVRNTY
jgi:hypothetical protein